MSPPPSGKKLLLIGASRGLGFALAEEYLKRGWHVVATERVRTTSQLHNLLETSEGRLEIESVDIVHSDQVAALRARLASRKFDLLFVNAGVKNDGGETINDVSTDEFVRVMTGWVRTELGGPQGRLSIEESIPNLANTMDAQAGKAGLQYLDYLGRTVAW